MLANRVRELSTTTGTGDITLAGAMPGHIGFADAFAPGDSVIYVIEDGDNYEIGTGTLADSVTLARTAVLETLVAGAYTQADASAIDLSGNARVYCAATADFLLSPTHDADVIREVTSGAGVTADGVLLKDGGILASSTLAVDVGSSGATPIRSVGDALGNFTHVELVTGSSQRGKLNTNGGTLQLISNGVLELHDPSGVALSVSGGTVAVANDLTVGDQVRLSPTAAGFPDLASGEAVLYASDTFGNMIGGRGSSTDVYITNRNGSGVMKVLAGSVDVAFNGAVTLASHLTVQGQTILGSSASMAGSLTVSGNVNQYLGLLQDQDINLTLGSVAGSAPRIYLYGTGNGLGNAGAIDIRTAGNSGLVTVGGDLSVQGALAASGAGTFAGNGAFGESVATNPTLVIGKQATDNGGLSTLQFFAKDAGAGGNSFRISFAKNASTDELRFVDGGNKSILTLQNTNNRAVFSGLASLMGDLAPTGDGMSMGDYGATGGYKWIQSFNNHPLYLNPLGNNVVFGADVEVPTGGLAANTLGTYFKGSAAAPAFLIDADGTGVATGLFGNADLTSEFLGIAVAGTEAVRWDAAGSSFYGDVHLSGGLTAQGQVVVSPTEVAGFDAAALSGLSAGITVAGANTGTSAGLLELGGHRNGADAGVLGRLAFHNHNSNDSTNNRKVAEVAAWSEGNNTEAGQLRFYTHGAATSYTLQWAILSNGELVGSSSGTIRRGVTDGSLALSGGSTSASGGNLLLCGEAHATLAGNIHLRSGGVDRLVWDNAAGTWNFSGFSIAGADHIVRGIADDNLGLSGGAGAGTGGNIILYGEGHATNPSDILFRDGTTDILIWDSSAQGWNFLQTEIVNTPTIRRGIASSHMKFSGGSTTTQGGNITLFGETHAGQAGDIIFRSGSDTAAHFDASAGAWHFNGTDLGSVNAVWRGASASYMELSGGSDAGAGANVLLYGESHATAPDKIVFRRGGTWILEYNGSSAWNFQNQGIASAAYVTSFGNISAGGKLISGGGANISVQNGVDGGSSHGLFLWSSSDNDHGVYMATSGGGKSLADGAAAPALDGRTGFQIRNRINASAARAFGWENSDEQMLMSLTADSGDLYTKGFIQTPNQMIGDNGSQSVRLNPYHGTIGHAVVGTASGHDFSIMVGNVAALTFDYPTNNAAFSGEALVLGGVTATALKPSGWNSDAGSRLLSVAGTGAFNDAGVSFGREDSTNVRASLWMDGSSGKVYLDNNWDSATADIVFRTRTSGATRTVLTLKGDSGAAFGGNASISGDALDLGSNTDIGATFNFRSNRTSANATIANLTANWNGDEVAQIRFLTGDDTVNRDNGQIQFLTTEDAGGGPTVRATVGSDGSWDFQDNGIATSGIIKGKADTTANRPSASVAGVGAQMFDTTLGKPIWSDGSQWVDATGASA